MSARDGLGTAGKNHAGRNDVVLRRPHPGTGDRDASEYYREVFGGEISVAREFGSLRCH